MLPGPLNTGKKKWDLVTCKQSPEEQVGFMLRDLVCVFWEGAEWLCKEREECLGHREAQELQQSLELVVYWLNFPRERGAVAVCFERELEW